MINIKIQFKKNLKTLYLKPIPRFIIPLNIPRLIAGGPLNPLGIEPIGPPPLPSPRPLKLPKKFHSITFPASIL